MYRLHDDNNNPLSTEYGLCKYRNHQVITVQELPETAPAGQLPRSAEVSRLLWVHIILCPASRCLPRQARQLPQPADLCQF